MQVTSGLLPPTIVIAAINAFESASGKVVAYAGNVPGPTTRALVNHNLVSNIDSEDVAALVSLAQPSDTCILAVIACENKPSLVHAWANLINTISLSLSVSRSHRLDLSLSPPSLSQQSSASKQYSEAEHKAHSASTTTRADSNPHSPHSPNATAVRSGTPPGQKGQASSRYV
ncbi:hypothetical protein NUW54_g13632 [Trametes sanguinea]|uniref:Uncharacterized protein n=1 Tax=Trametes sanguinea TaxID=158606 RepID=A0ACC1MJ36_9APHY|nr:hypothetical protein NUW54_g13632 [Trametes sanguinea]